MAENIEGRAPRWVGWISPAAWLASALLLLLALGPPARFAATSASWLDYPYPRPGSEGLILYESLLLKHGGDIYAPITPDRFISGPYPPVYYWLAAALLPDTLPDFSTAGSATSIFQGGRIVSLAAAIATGILLPVLVLFQCGYHRQGRRLLFVGLTAGAMAGLAFLSLPQVVVWATRFRGDMLMIALTAAGLTCIAIGTSTKPTEHRPGFTWAWLLAGAALFALAFFTKQTAIAGPVATAAYLLLRDRRTCVKWCISMALLLLIPFALLDLATGHWFYLKMVTYHSLPLRGLTLTRLLQYAFWEDQWPLIILAVTQAAYFLLQPLRRWRDRAQHTHQLLIPLFTLASLVTLLTGAVVGADHNHLLMPGLAISAGTGALVAHLLAQLTAGNRLRPTIAASGAITALLLATYILFTSEPSSWYKPELVIPPADQQEQLRKIVLNISKNTGTLFFSDDPGFLALAGKQTPYDDPFTMTALAPLERWDETHYRNSLAHGDFSLLLLSCDVTAPNTCRADTLTPGVLDAIRSGYNVLFRDIMFTYVPK